MSASARLTDAEIEEIIFVIEEIPAAVRAERYAPALDGQVVRALRQQQAEIVELRQKLAAHAVMGDEIGAIADRIDAAVRVLVEAAR